VEEILKRAKRVASEAEVYEVSYEETPVVFEANRLKQLQTSQGTTVALRLIREGRLGFATASGEVDPQKLVDMAVETSRFGTPARFRFPDPDAYPPIEVWDAEVEKVSLEAMTGLGESLIAQVRGHAPELVCQCHIIRAVATRRLLNSQGGHAVYKRSVFSVELTGTLVRDTDMLFVSDVQSSCHPIQEVAGMAQTIREQLELSRRQARVSSGQMPVIFTPRGVASALIMPLTLAINGKVVLQGASPLANRLGEVVFDERLSLRDDATIPFRPHSRPCDDEGTPSRPIVLVERGMPAGFLYDLQTAAQAGASSTGSGLRSGGGMPSPSASALVLEEGEAGFHDMVRDMKEGLVVEQLMGAGQGNVLGGEFSGNVLLGYKVERGEIVGRVKDTMVSGNIYKALREIIAVGDRASWVGGALLAPHIYCARLAVATKG